MTTDPRSSHVDHVAPALEQRIVDLERALHDRDHVIAQLHRRLAHAPSPPLTDASAGGDASFTTHDFTQRIITALPGILSV